MQLYSSKELAKLENWQEKKKELDDIIIKSKAQPVGWGYIDIIVHRDKFEEFLLNTINASFIITDISWWLHCDKKNKISEFGYGGPLSRFYTGWFSELCISFDELQENYYLKFKNNEEMKLHLENIIKNKKINYPDNRSLSFKDNLELTPAFWLDVPENWKNAQETA